MFRKEDLIIFLDKLLSVGIPHTIIEGRLFYYYGKLIEIDAKEIKLETETGFRLISVEKIVDIHLDRRQT